MMTKANLLENPWHKSPRSLRSGGWVYQQQGDFLIEIRKNLPESQGQFFRQFISTNFLNFFLGEFPACDLPVDQFSAAIEMEEDFDGGVTPLFPD
jgi:hypothetical protein